MKVLNEEAGLNKSGSTFVLILDKKEARTLLEIVEAAHESNKRRNSFRVWRKNLEERLCVF